MLSRVSFILRHAAMLFAMMGYLAHGAQSHISFAQGETVSVLICGQGGSRTVDMQFGDPSGPQETAPDCCDDCTHASESPPMDGDSFAGNVNILPVRVLLSRQAQPVHPGGPLWPGAPPNGPPFLI
ncbi:MAG: hypothetical protein AAF950_11465 [Pseudomonadota bacterium]